VSSGTLFTRIPSWLREALAAQEPDVPNILGAIVDPVLDVGQGGWGEQEGVWTTQGIDKVGTNDTTVVHAASRTLGALIILEVQMILAGGRAGTGRGLIRDVVSLEAVGLFRVTGTTTPGFYPHVTCAGHSYPFLIPPGCSFELAIDADDNVANAISVQVAKATFRAGFKPI